MRSASGEFETSPWDEVINWGRCVKVDSVDDISAVHRLVAAPGGDRRAVVFEWLNKVQRQTLIDAIQATGLGLRPFDDHDRHTTTFRLSGFERLLIIPGLPHLLMMRLRGRTTQMYEVTKAHAVDRHALKKIRKR